MIIISKLNCPAKDAKLENLLILSKLLFSKLLKFLQTLGTFLIININKANTHTNGHSIIHIRNKILVFSQHSHFRVIKIEV